jgi:hypothetical protein
MGHFETFKTLKAKEEYESFKIDYAHQSIEAQIRMVVFKDKDTKQFVVIVPSLDVTGYGSSKKKAMEMLKFSLDDFNSNLLKNSIGGIHNALKKLGWKRNPLTSKNFSKSYIDIYGELKGFNIEDNIVTEEILTLA